MKHLSKNGKNKSFSGYTRIHYKLTLIPINFAVIRTLMIKSKYEKVVQNTLRKRQYIVYNYSSSVCHKLIHKTPRKSPFRNWENPVPVSEYAPGFPTYVAWNRKAPLGQRGGPSLHRRVLYVAHAWADGELINIKCAMFVD